MNDNKMTFLWLVNIVSDNLLCIYCHLNPTTIAIEVATTPTWLCYVIIQYDHHILVSKARYHGLKSQTLPNTNKMGTGVYVRPTQLKPNDVIPAHDGVDGLLTKAFCHNGLKM